MSCISCNKAKTSLVCGICKEDLCKNCTSFLDEETFSFYAKIPAELSHTAYCWSCHTTHVEPALATYNEIMTRTKDILVFTKDQGKETRLVKRLEDPVGVASCADYDETILRLAFFAAQKGYNAIIDVDVRSEKVRNAHGYQASDWSGTGLPANFIEHHSLKDRALWQNPN